MISKMTATAAMGITIAITFSGGANPMGEIEVNNQLMRGLRD